MSITLQDIICAGQMRAGMVLILEKKNGVTVMASVKEVLHPGTDREEIIICKRKNLYFITDKLIRGTSWVRHASIVDGAVMCCITNNSRAFVSLDDDVREE